MAGTKYRSAVPLFRDRSMFSGEQQNAPLKNGEGVFWIDPTPAAPKINFKIKDSTGAIRTASITLT